MRAACRRPTIDNRHPTIGDPPPEPRDWLALAAFVAGALLAGGNGVAVRFSNRELDPVWGAALRLTVAAVILLMLMAILRLPMPRGKRLRGAVLYGVLQFSGAFGLYYYALVEVHAGLGQMLLALVPLTTVLLAAAQRQESLSLPTVGGSLLGLVGVGLAISNPLRGSVSVMSVLAILGSVICFAQAAIVVRRIPRANPIALNAVGMLAGGLLLLAISASVGEQFELPERTETWVALVYVVAAGSVAVFLLYVFLIQRWTASRAAYVLLVIPLVTLLLSAWLDDEPLHAALIIGGALVLLGVYIGAFRPKHRSSRTADVAA